MTVVDDVFAILQSVLARPDVPLDARLAEALRLLAKHRSESLLEALPALGSEVRRGPFTGMRLTGRSAEGCYVAKLLGTYEHDLHPTVEAFDARGYRDILNIGCAEGYYAVGLARRLDAVEVFAHDIDENACARCVELSALNGVAQRVHVGGRVHHADFARFADRPGRTLVLCDIEGGERDLLDPELAPTLATMDVLVEVHEVFAAGTGALLEERFAATHTIERIPFGATPLPPLPELAHLEHLDQLLAVWEWRLADPGWLWLEARA